MEIIIFKFFIMILKMFSAKILEARHFTVTQGNTRNLVLKTLSFAIQSFYNYCLIFNSDQCLIFPYYLTFNNAVHWNFKL